ncbi:MAG: glycosyltransferase family 10 [Xenococcaceae cyanobacterium MO_207.B15]|nr:glycosyltransferase family 10 [Xenococcaceae cyanobacterium MO_207.B15]
MEKKKIEIGFAGKCWGKISATRYPFKSILEKKFNVFISNAPQYIFVNVTEDSMQDFLLNYLDVPIRIFYAGEAIVPDFNLFDYAIGFDYINFNDRYHKIHPLIFFERYLKYGNLFQRKDFNTLLDSKRNFCDFIYSNSKANSNRDEFFFALSEYKQVSSIGRHLNNCGTEYFRSNYNDNWRERKIEFQASCKFSIAFENSSHVGYTTEKLITPMLAGSIPIYWGNSRVAELFNAKTFINCHDYRSFSDVIEYVKLLDNDDKLYKKVLNQQCLTEEQIGIYESHKNQLENFLNHIFEQSLSHARRRADGTWNTRYEENYKKSFLGVLSKKNTYYKLFDYIKNKIIDTYK